MEKNIYIQPQIKVCSLEIKQFVVASVINVNNDDSDTGIGYGGEGHGPAYAPSYQPYGIWEDQEE